MLHRCIAGRSGTRRRRPHWRRTRPSIVLASSRMRSRGSNPPRTMRRRTRIDDWPGRILARGCRRRTPPQQSRTQRCSFRSRKYCRCSIPWGMRWHCKYTRLRRCTFGPRSSSYRRCRPRRMSRQNVRRIGRSNHNSQRGMTPHRKRIALGSHTLDLFRKRRRKRLVIRTPTA